MGYGIHLRASFAVFSIHQRIWEPLERIAANPFRFSCAELLVELQQFNNSLKLSKEQDRDLR